MKWISLKSENHKNRLSKCFPWFDETRGNRLVLYSRVLSRPPTPPHIFKKIGKRDLLDSRSIFEMRSNGTPRCYLAAEVVLWTSTGREIIFRGCKFQQHCGAPFEFQAQPDHEIIDLLDLGSCLYIERTGNSLGVQDPPPPSPIENCCFPQS